MREWAVEGGDVDGGCNDGANDDDGDVRDNHVVKGMSLIL